MSYAIISPSDDKTSVERCQEIAEALWTIERPRAIRGAEDVTAAFCGIVTHTDGRAALKLAASDLIVPNADLDTAELFGALPEYTAQKKGAVTSKLAANHGVAIPAGDILPTSLSFTTHDEMSDDGWFNDEI